jgi:UDP-glucose 4-epimerase
MNYLITGGSGYIGSALIKRLALNSNDVIYVLQRDVKLSDTINVINLVADLSLPGFQERLPKKIDIVLHLAQSSRYREFPDGALDMFDVGISGMFHLLEWARNSRVSKFIYFSTGNVYQPAQKKLLEGDACEPNSFYGASKLCAELLLKQYRDFFQPVILRIFGVYGRYQTKMLIPNLIARIREGKEIVLAGGVGMYFTPLYIDDCVEFVCRICEKNAPEKIFNLAGDEIVNICEVAKIIGNIIGIEPVFQLNDKIPTWLIGDNTIVKSITGYSPEFSVNEGLKRVLMDN